jgi:hypothetical protein
MLPAPIRATVTDENCERHNGTESIVLNVNARQVWQKAQDSLQTIEASTASNEGGGSRG